MIYMAKDFWRIFAIEDDTNLVGGGTYLTKEDASEAAEKIGKAREKGMTKWRVVSVVPANTEVFVDENNSNGLPDQPSPTS